MKLFLFLAFMVAFTPAEAHAFFFVAAIPAAAGAAASSAAAGAAAAAAASAAAASAAATAATIATATQIAMGVASAASAVFSGIAAKNQAEAEAAQMRLNAKLEGTAGLQRDTIRREELARTLGAIRAARGDRGQMSPTAVSFLDEANEFISSDRTVELLNSRQRSADFRQQATAARRRGRASLLTGVAKAGGSLFQTGSYVARAA